MFLGDVAAGNSYFGRARNSRKGQELGVLNLPSPRFTLERPGVSPMRGVTRRNNGDSPLAIVAADNEADPPFEGILTLTGYCWTPFNRRSPARRLAAFVPGLWRPQ